MNHGHFAVDGMLDSLYRLSEPSSDWELAARYAPVIRFDVNEPFLPLAAGYMVFRESGASYSFRQGYRVQVEAPVALAIEYAIWWDWDIGHLYELEHVWVYVGQDGQVVDARASWHGGQKSLALDGRIAMQGDHVIVYSEPGKHAFAPTPEWFLARRKKFARSESSELFGFADLLASPYIAPIQSSPLTRALVRSYLAERAFEPTDRYDQVFRFEPQMLVPWSALAAWIPKRIAFCLAQLERDYPPARRRPLRVGHRGAAAYAPDNTLAGIRIAAKQGADMVEIDLQRTVDGAVVLAHDPFLTASDGRVLPISRSTLAELQAVDLGEGERMPTLVKALKTLQQVQIGAYIEIKDGSVLPFLLHVIREERLASYLMLSSFRPDWLAAAKSQLPPVTTSILFGATELDPVALARSIGASYVHPCWERFEQPSALLTPDWLAAVRAAGLGVICWHEERLEEVAALQRLGVDGICSDDPALLRHAWETRN